MELTDGGGAGSEAAEMFGSAAVVDAGEGEVGILEETGSGEGEVEEILTARVVLISRVKAAVEDVGSGALVEGGDPDAVVGVTVWVSAVSVVDDTALCGWAVVVSSKSETQNR